MLQPELKLRRDKIRWLMAQQGIDAALITCNVNLLYTYGRVVSGYLYLPLNAPARLFIKRPNTISGEHIFSVRKPEQIPDILAEENKLLAPLQEILTEDEGLYGIDEIMALSIVNVYGSIGFTNYGYIDKVKPGILKELNAHDGEHVHTFLDDIVGAIAAAAASRLAHSQPDLSDITK